MTAPAYDARRSHAARVARAVLAATAVLLAHAISAGAQPVRATMLRGPADELDDAFTRIIAVRELADGRLLVADGGEDMRLAVVDWRTGAVRAVGREGAGPGEYRSIWGLTALGGDSTLLEDRRTGRWLLVDGDRFVGSNRIPTGRGGLPRLAGADHRGRVLRIEGASFRAAAGMRRALQMVEFADSANVVVARRDSAAGTTIARIKGPWNPTRMVRKPVVPGGEPIMWIVESPFATSDRARMFPDGWVAIVYASPYRVAWHASDGRRTGGRPLPFARVPVDARQRRLAMAREYSPSVGMREDEMPAWPDVLPAFIDRDRVGPLADPAGRIVIRRTEDAVRPGTFYDVVDRTGALVGRIALPASEHLVGFGARSAYVVATDDDGLQWLRRHPWP